MNIPIEFLIRAGQPDTTEALKKYAARRLSFALRRFQDRIRHISVRLVDVNGPKRGVDSRCSIVADLVDGQQLFVEATAYPGDGKLTITGQLGDVMKESASAALSYLKANAWRWGKTVDPEWFRVHDLHVHVPAGAVPKDGPSAGITMATAMVSPTSTSAPSANGSGVA